MAIWSRNRFYSGVSETPTFASGDAVAENNSTDGYLTKFVISPITDALNRSTWFRTLKYQFLKAFVHKEEDRDSVTATPSTLTKYVAKDQLPEITSVVNDMTDGSDTAGNINMFDVSTDVSGINKLFKLSFSSAGLVYLKARTWLQSELEALITDTATPLIDDAIADIPYVAPVTYIGSELTPFVINSLTYVNVPNVLFTNSANTTKYLVSFTYTVFIATNDAGGETNGVVVKVFNEDTAGIYDESEFQLGAVTTSANTKTQGSFQSILTLSPTHRIRLAAKCTGSLEVGGEAQTISNVRFSILEIK